MTKPLILGYAPSVEGMLPLNGSSGNRLAKMAGMPLPALLDQFTCANLLPFPIDRKRVAAHRAHISAGDAWRWILRCTPERPVILLGRRVEHAVLQDLFQVRRPWFTWGTDEGFPVVVVPHPSGLNRLYNDPRRRRAVSSALRVALATATLGGTDG